ncbi:hypothetical protein CAEBREN_18033 [Caenorhabditis brenneri]|uniref:Uncharacterized protein n=1 Tax=Caenorhabditis brenneri TaxID=135651 RepID=G0MMN4_CAEBE|nr:hypothetical protein CAEBREN_18033 [Caenorhabditis brenneri]
MDFDQEDDFIGLQIASIGDNTQKTHLNIPDVSLIDRFVFREDNMEEEHVFEKFGNQQGIELSNGQEEVFVNDLEFDELHQSNSMNGIEVEEHQEVEYVAGSGEAFLDNLEFTDLHQSNHMDVNDIDEYQEVEYASDQEEVYIDDMVQTDYYQSNSMAGYDNGGATDWFITIPWNHYYTPRELFLQREVNNKDKQISDLKNQVSKMNDIVLKHQNQCGNKKKMMQKAQRQFTSFNEALQIWKDLGRRFPVPRDVSHLNLHLYLFDPNSKQHCPQTKRSLTNGYQLRRCFTGEHRGQTLSEKRKWDNYCRKLSYLQDKQEGAGLIRALSASKEETERKWKNAVKRAHLGF